MSVDISVSITEDKVDIIATPTVNIVNVTNSASIDPSLYDLSEFTNTSPNPFVRTSGLSSYVPTSRTLTINGTTQDLSANRTFTIASGVTDVTATAPIESTGGTTPDISIRQSGSLDDGYLSSADWIAFNNKQDALTLTTTGTSGAATLVGATLNIPQYSGGGGGGVHALLQPTTGQQTSPAITATTMNSTVLIANRLFSLPFIPANTFTCSNLYINAGTTVVGGLGRILIYSDLNGKPDQKIYESADLDLSIAGIKTATTSFTFNAGTTYWLTIHANSANNVSALGVGSLILIRTNGVSQVSGYAGSATFGSAPTTYPSLIFLTSTVPCVFITAA